MDENTLKSFLNLKEEGKRKNIDLDDCNEEERVRNEDVIKRLFDIALERRFLIYFDGTAVDEPYDGLEFKNLEDEFYYNNGNSYLVFRDIQNTEVAFKIKYLKKYDFKKVYKIVENAVKCTMKNPELSKYKLYGEI